jgi:diguanylate cyclase (GGDEF)-like protein
MNSEQSVLRGWLAGAREPAGKAQDAPMAPEKFPLLQPLQRPSPRRHITAALVGALIWIACCWIGSGQYVDRQEQSAVSDAERNVADDIADITTGLRRNLAVYHGIPAAIGRDLEVRQALATFGPGNLPSSLTRAEKQLRWHRAPLLAQLNRTLAASAKDIPAFSVIWVMNAAGDAIAASNAATGESFVGTNYADREYFQSTRAGRYGNQFAVGRVTRVPGLFFSAPVTDGGRFLGAVAVKIDLPFLAYWVNQANALVTDPNGVIILAQDKSLEMHALPGARVRQLTPGDRLGRYQLDRISELSLGPWGDPPSARLKQLGGQPVPVVIKSEPVSDEGLAVTVMRAVPQSASRLADFARLFVASAGLGILLIAILATTTFLVSNWQRVRRFQEQQAQVEYLARHDTLTGLFSRAMIDQLIPHGIAVCERTGRRLAVMYVDLDLFKNINDSMGHEVGDEVLLEVAQRLRGAVRAADAVIRQGGDEFIVVLNDLGSVDDAAHIARKLIEAVSQPYLVRDVNLSLSASVGIAVYPEDGDSTSVLVRNADSALYHAKESGRADFNFYHASMNADTLARLAIESALRDAIRRCEMVLHYQPQYDLHSQRVTGYEALVRWEDPQRGTVSPAHFIPLAEDTGLIVPLGQWVLETACRQLANWAAQPETAQLSMAVNVSARQLRHPEFVEGVIGVLDRTGADPRRLKLELTESMMVERVEETIEKMRVLKAKGVGFSLDDFGTGYSSLSYLKRLPLDQLKIDQSFVRDVLVDPNDAAIARTIVALARSLNLGVIAEGVETEQQRDFLAENGCHVYQGYLFGRPRPMEGIEQPHLLQ